MTFSFKLRRKGVSRAVAALRAQPDGAPFTPERRYRPQVPTASHSRTAPRKVGGRKGGHIAATAAKKVSFIAARPGQVGEALRRTNRWWRTATAGGASWTSDDPDLRSVARARFSYHPKPLEHLLPGGLYVLRGPRRVGKSVELKRAIATLLDQGIAARRIIHASVDGWRDADLGMLFTAGREIETRGVTQTRFWFIDEITSVVGDWANRIKWLRDNTALRDDCVVLTGSSSASFDHATKALRRFRDFARNRRRYLKTEG